MEGIILPGDEFVTPIKARRPKTVPAAPKRRSSHSVLSELGKEFPDTESKVMLTSGQVGYHQMDQEPCQYDDQAAAYNEDKENTSPDSILPAPSVRSLRRQVTVYPELSPIQNKPKWRRRINHPVRDREAPDNMFASTTNLPKYPDEDAVNGPAYKYNKTVCTIALLITDVIFFTVLICEIPVFAAVPIVLGLRYMTTGFANGVTKLVNRANQAQQETQTKLRTDQKVKSK